MDLKAVLSNSEDALPTLEQNLSTGTAVTAGTSSLPTITADASTYWKMGGSTVMGLAGMVYLGYGKKNGDVPKMIIGAVLTLGSLFMF
ncbi:MAG: hypothetical protein PHS14_03355 [Elusimicrobia bacterium]|nr:hypothetical protein [Elusimicrobiota bacterium]